VLGRDGEEVRRLLRGGVNAALAKNFAMEFLRPEACIRCAYQGYRLASFLWTVTSAKSLAEDDEAETRAWLTDMHASALIAFQRADREALARLALEIVPETEAAIAVLREKAEPGEAAEFLESLLRKVGG